MRAVNVSSKKLYFVLTKNNFEVFFNAFREESFDDGTQSISKPVLTNNDTLEEKVGYIEINEDDLNDGDDEISDWFK